MQDELVKMSSKGQLVVPKSIRKKEKFKASDRFVAVDVNGGVLFKRISILNTKIELESLSNDINRHFRENGIKKSDIKKAIEWSKG